MATRFACGQGKKTDRFGRPSENNVSQLRGGRPLGEGTVVHGGATLNAQQRQMWLSSPGTLIRAMACDFTKHIGAKLNNRDPQLGVVVFVLISSPDSPEGAYGRRRRRKNLAKL